VPFVRCEDRADLGFGASGGEFIEVDGGESAIDADRVLAMEFYSIFRRNSRELAKCKLRKETESGTLCITALSLSFS